MATSPDISSLTAIPWPVLAGASLLLHVGVVRAVWPRMVQVSRPGVDSSVNIPVMLVDEDNSSDSPPVSSAVAAPAPVSDIPTSSQTNSQTANSQVVTPESAEVRSQPPSQPSPVTTTTRESAQPIPDNTDQPTDRPSEAPDSAPVATPIDPSESNPGPQATGETDDRAQSDLGPTRLSIIDEVYLPKDSGGDQIDQYPTPGFSIPTTFDIPRDHSCQGRLTADVITLGVLVDADGWVSSLRLLQPDIYAQNSDLAISDCLLSASLPANTLRFTPAIRQTNIGEEEAVPTDRVQLQLRFSQE